MNKLTFIPFALLAVSASSAAEPPPASGASIKPDPHKYASFDYSEPARKAKLRLTVPEGLPVVRGILVVPPFSGGDTRDFHKEVWFREFLHFHGFAFLGADWTGSNDERFKVFQAALKQFAEDSKHPELVNAPLVATGFSAGGGFSSKLIAEVPDKVIAAVIVGSRPNFGTIAEAQRGIPVCILNGEDEGNGMAAAVEPLLADNRPKGALWGWMAIQDLGHARDNQEVFAMPMLDAAVRLRYPADADVSKGPVKLKPIDPESGWVADNKTWKSGLVSIAPAKEFKGDIGKLSWLLNEDLAFVYRAYATYHRPLTITSPQHTTKNALQLVWDTDSSATIAVDDSKFTGWKKLELFDGSKRVAELTNGAANFTVKNLTAGYHPFTVLGTDAKGNVRPSNPVLVTVRK